jgi:hypothetical protein
MELRSANSPPKKDSRRIKSRGPARYQTDGIMLAGVSNSDFETSVTNGAAAPGVNHI